MEQFLVEMFLPEITEDFVEMIPSQRDYINDCMAKGSICSYALSADRDKVWIVFNTKTELEMRRLLNRFPIIKMVTYKSFPLMFHNSMELMLPAISLN
ncbi:MAG: hypothetical protein JWO03_2754 [Bacteroidetes bacterium]|nr:hypothetical protein [Bacteroidota bacterium]